MRFLPNNPQNNGKNGPFCPWTIPSPTCDVAASLSSKICIAVDFAGLRIFSFYPEKNRAHSVRISRSIKDEKKRRPRGDLGFGKNAHLSQRFFFIFSLFLQSSSRSISDEKGGRNGFWRSFHHFFNGSRSLTKPTLFWEKITAALFSHPFLTYFVFSFEPHRRTDVEKTKCKFFFSTLPGATWSVYLSSR